jgi:hypothetical protein
MKNLKKLLTLLLLASNFIAFSQKVKFDDNLITVDKEPYAKMVKTSKGGILAAKEYLISNLKDVELIKTKAITIIMPKMPNAIMDDTDMPIFIQEIDFIGIGKVEIPYTAFFAKNFPQEMYEKSMLKADGTLNPESVKSYIAAQPKLHEEYRAFIAIKEKLVKDDKSNTYAVYPRLVMRRRFEAETIDFSRSIISQKAKADKIEEIGFFQESIDSKTGTTTITFFAGPNKDFQIMKLIQEGAIKGAGVQRWYTDCNHFYSFTRVYSGDTPKQVVISQLVHDMIMNCIL